MPPDPVFYGCSRVVLPEGVGGVTLSGPEATERKDMVLQRDVLIHVTEYSGGMVHTQDTYWTVHATMRLVKRKIRKGKRCITGGLNPKFLVEQCCYLEPSYHTIVTKWASFCHALVCLWSQY